MRHYHLYIIISGQHVAADHVRHGAGGLREILLHGEWCLLHDLTVDGFRTMGMQDDDCLTFIEEREERVKFWRTKILTKGVCRQFDAVGTEYVQRIAGFLDGGVDIGQGCD